LRCHLSPRYVHPSHCRSSSASPCLLLPCCLMAARPNATLLSRLGASPPSTGLTIAWLQSQDLLRPRSPPAVLLLILALHEGNISDRGARACAIQLLRRLRARHEVGIGVVELVEDVLALAAQEVVNPKFGGVRVARIPRHCYVHRHDEHYIRWHHEADGLA